MAHPLELSYRWQAPAILASVGAVIILGALSRSDAPGRGPVVAVVLALWVLFMVLVWLRTRASLAVDGDQLAVRTALRTHVVEASRLVEVRQFLTPHGPSYKLRVRGEDGRLRTHVAPVALLRSGHSTLFEWILARAPEAELDRGSRRTLDQLRVKGLVP